MKKFAAWNSGQNPQPLDAAIHTREAQQRGQAVPHGADEQRRQQVAEHTAQCEGNCAHAEAGGDSTHKPKQQHVGQRKQCGQALKLRNAHGRGEQGGQAVVPQHLNQMRQAGRRRDQHRHARTDRKLGPHRALAAERCRAKDCLHAAAALH